MFLPHWLRSLSRSMFVERRMKRRRAKPSRRRGGSSGRLAVEMLEERVVPTTYEVVQSVSGPNQYTTLAAAVGAASSGDTIQIDLNSNPSGATIPAGLSSLTIQGDPSKGATQLKAAGTELGALTVNAASVVVTNLYLNSVSLGGGQDTISNSIFDPNGGITSPNGSGGGNSILGQCVLRQCVDQPDRRLATTR